VQKILAVQERLREQFLFALSGMPIAYPDDRSARGFGRQAHHLHRHRARLPARCGQALGQKPPSLRLRRRRRDTLHALASRLLGWADEAGIVLGRPQDVTRDLTGRPALS
jgi:hypothetical protein